MTVPPSKDQASRRLDPFAVTLHVYDLGVESENRMFLYLITANKCWAFIFAVLAAIFYCEKPLNPAAFNFADLPTLKPRK